MPYQGPLNKNNILSQAFTLSVEVIFIFLTTASSLYLNTIYKRPILVAIYYTDFPVTIPNLYLFPALYLVNTTYKDKAITNILQKPLPDYH